MGSSRARASGAVPGLIELWSQKSARVRLFWSDLIAIVLRLFLRGVQFFATSRVVSASPTGASTRIPNLHR
jgi:hypothetical protein